MKNRNRTKVVTEILKTVYGHESDGEGITQNAIRYEVNLSDAQLREFLILLTLHGLLIYDSAMRRYHVTEKGLRLLQLCEQIDDLIGKKEKQQERW